MFLFKGGSTDSFTRFRAANQVEYGSEMDEFAHTLDEPAKMKDENIAPNKSSQYGQKVVPVYTILE